MCEVCVCVGVECVGVCVYACVCVYVCVRCVRVCLCARGGNAITYSVGI